MNAEAVMATMRAALGRVEGIRALALGGSRARGAHAADSDIDIGAYYRDESRPDFAGVLAAARALDDRGAPDGHAAFGEWGPWINGGVWLRVGGHKVDILLRDIARVDAVISDCTAGRIEVAYQPGHPHAFVSAIYAGEVYHNRILLDRGGELARLKARADPYPAALGEAIARRFGWEAAFSLAAARGAAGRGDVLYVHGCLFRAATCLVQVVHARNGRYLVNEKGALAAADALPVRPAGFRRRVEAALTTRALPQAVADLEALRTEVAQVEPA